jgi:hypothetical protein
LAGRARRSASFPISAEFAERYFDKNLGECQHPLGRQHRRKVNEQRGTKVILEARVLGGLLSLEE